MLDLPDEKSVPTRAQVEAALKSAVIPPQAARGIERARRTEAVRKAFEHLPKEILDQIESDLPSYEIWPKEPESIARQV